ncbi:MAG: CotH kinase family protein [Lachnospiraceae bacterium]|nr:CotH kinase family protein [Lachnospiraceae bacterium]
MFDKRLSGTRKIILIMLPVLLIVLCILCVMYEYAEDGEDGTNKVAVSADSGFYNSDVSISVTVPGKAQIYYTTDCSEPAAENGILYEAPIVLEAGEEECVYTLRFKAVYDDGGESKVVTRTYVTGVNVSERYDMKVLLVTGEPEDLFGYENGIFVAGKAYDEFKENNPDSYDGNGIDANFMQSGRESEREVYIQLFDEDGNTLFELNGGIRIRGGATRLKNQKSFTLYARKEYDEENRFRYTLFENLLSCEDGVVGKKYKQLIVRNSGQDNGFAFLRNELAGALAAEAGFPDVMFSTPVVCYINGTYQGVYWLENAFDEQYFENRYGEYEGSFVVLEGTDALKEEEEDGDKANYADEYNTLYNDFAGRDLTDDDNYAELCEFIDVQNYLQYFAIENYVGNYDWPTNNERVYRYVSSDGDYTENSVFDGRYRFMLYDVDYGFGLLTQYESVGILASSPTLNRILSGDSPLFAALMERQDCREYFVNYNCFLINGVMSSENVSSTVDDMHGSRYGELYHMLEETELLRDSLWIWENEDNLNIDYVNENIVKIKAFAEARPQTVIDDIKTVFGYGECYTLNVDRGDIYGNIEIEGLYMDADEFKGTYFQEIPIRITAQLTENEVFDYFLVNGEKCYDMSFVVDEGTVEDGEVNVSLETHYVDEPRLTINAVKSKGTGDFIELVNLSGQALSTGGYYLSDDEELYKYSLPSTVIQPGETLRIYGNNSLDPESLGSLEMNFNIKTGEVITLSYMSDIVEQLEIPGLSENGVYTREYSTGVFREYIISGNT